MGISNEMPALAHTWIITWTHALNNIFIIASFEK